MAEGTDRDVALELAVDPLQEVEIEFRGHTLRIRVGWYQHIRWLDPIETDQELALATALDGAAALDSFLAVTRTPLVKASECLLVVALATHMTLGLRILAIELLAIRERTVAVLTACAAAVFAVGLAFLLNAG